jgi:predicted lipoprotein with Yx(FWY)xxD motif
MWGLRKNTEKMGQVSKVTSGLTAYTWSNDEEKDDTFLGETAKLWKAIITCIMSDCMDQHLNWSKDYIIYLNTINKNMK